MEKGEKIAELYLLFDAYKAGSKEALDKATGIMKALAADNSEQCIEAICQFFTNNHSLETNTAFLYLYDKDPEAVAQLLEKKLNAPERMQQKKGIRILNTIAGKLAGYMYAKGSPLDYPLAVKINERLPKILELAADESPVTRGHAIAVLGSIGTDAGRILPVLKNAVSNPEPFAGGDDARYALKIFERNQKRAKIKPKKAAKKPKTNAEADTWRMAQTITYGGTREAIQKALDAGEDINLHDDIYPTPLIVAINNQKDDMAQFLLEKGADIHVTDTVGCPPLYYAAKNGSLELVEKLLKMGADPNKPSYFPPLIVAFADAHKFRRLNLEVFEEVNGVKTKITDQRRIDEIAGKDRYTNFPAIVKLLLEAGADKNAVTGTGQTALHYAGDWGDDELAECLLPYKPDLNIRDTFGLTALHFACRKGFEKVADLLLKHGADPNIGDNYGFTPLHEAAENNRPEITALLLVHAADKTIGLQQEFDAYKKGTKAVDIARKLKFKEVVSLLS